MRPNPVIRALKQSAITVLPPPTRFQSLPAVRARAGPRQFRRASAPRRGAAGPPGIRAAPRAPRPNTPRPASGADPGGARSCGRQNAENARADSPQTRPVAYARSTNASPHRAAAIGPTPLRHPVTRRPSHDPDKGSRGPPNRVATARDHTRGNPRKIRLRDHSHGARATSASRARRGARAGGDRKEGRTSRLGGEPCARRQCPRDARLRAWRAGKFRRQPHH